MNLEWQEFISTELSAAGATKPGAGTDLLVALRDWGVVHVSGADAGEFLQAHFTNDVAAVGESSVQLSGYCNPKGRLLALFYLTQRSGEYYLISPRDVIDSVLNRLNMFAKMARPTAKQSLGKMTKTAVELNDISDERVVVGLAGKQASAALQSWLVASDAAVTEIDAGVAIHTSELSILPVPVTGGSPENRWLCVGTPACLRDLWHGIKAVATIAGSEQWILEDIRAGLPSIVAATQDKFVPQMSNLHLLNGISFTKGCYPGQEIVARMQYLGTLKRRTERFSYSGSPVAPGAEIVTADDQAGAGVVINSATAGDGQSELLAVVKVSVADQILHIGTSDGPSLKRLPLPYSLDAQVQDEPEKG